MQKREEKLTPGNLSYKVEPEKIREFPGRDILGGPPLYTYTVPW